MNAIRALMTGIMDYAGLFPPAALDMPSAVRNYSEYVLGPRAWMLGRFVTPVARLGEFEAAAADALTGEETWFISALAGEDLNADLARIAAFNHTHAPRGRGAMGGAVIDAVEVKADTVSKIEAALEAVPDEVFPFFEIPLDHDPRGLIAALAGAAAGAKVRTGGVTPEAVPSARALAGFLVSCAAAETPFKATAGLHHAICGEHRLTYAPDSAKATMFGFLNVFIAAAVAAGGGAGAEDITAILEERSADALRIDSSAAWARGLTVSVEQIEAVRREFALSFGTCSFTEPVEELEAMGLLESVR